jgi:hypothetical protein
MPKDKSVEFDAVIRKATDMDNFYIPVEFDVEKTFGKKRLKVKIWYDKILYRGLLTRYNGEYNLMINKEVREKVGKQPGEKVHVKIVEDTEERTIEIPPFLETFLKKDKALKEAFEKLSYTHKKEHILWLVSAKKDETLQNRLIKFREYLSIKKKK